MVKLDTLQKIVGPGLVAVIRASSAEQAARIAHACVDGGAKASQLLAAIQKARGA